jgi:fumarate reductase subunit C
MAYVRPVSKTTWYMAKRSYTIHMLQELTSLFVGILALILLWGISAVARGPEVYRGFLDGLAGPGMIVLLWVTTVVMFYHAIAWFSVTPKAMPVQRGEVFVPGSIIAGAHYVIWFVLSLAILLLAGVF